MPGTATTKPSAASALPTAVGIDVGGEHKGFHAVAITGGSYSTHIATKDVEELASWCCVTMRARVIAVDAPCRWSKDGHARLAERQLMEKQIWCFSTPTRRRAVEREGQSALGKATNHYGWMLQGEALFKALERTHTLCLNLPVVDRQNICFETFPHAITWHLRGGRADASCKRGQRLALLQGAGIDLSKLTNIDLVDAALCALTAYHAATGRECMSFGEPNTGLIIVPARQNP
jgi:predicted nuclease with RNAse H fold